MTGPFVPYKGPNKTPHPPLRFSILSAPRRSTHPRLLGGVGLLRELPLLPALRRSSGVLQENGHDPRVAGGGRGEGERGRGGREGGGGGGEILGQRRRLGLVDVGRGANNSNFSR